MLLVFGGIFGSAEISVHAQNTRFDFEYIKNADPWLRSENAAGINNMSDGSFSYAESYFNKSNGKLVNYYESDDSYLYGARAESFYRLDRKTVFYGKIDYSNFIGKHMGGTASIDPYYNPFNIDEYADSTAGDKHKETYSLAGGASSLVSKSVVAGFKFDYKTVSYFKTRDLRHINDLLDMSMVLGMRYLVKKHTGLGINYHYRRTSEDIVFGTSGNKDQQYNSLIDYGLFLGKQERFSTTGTGYTISGDTRPYFNEFHGVSLQSDVRFAGFGCFSELSYKHRSGHFGIQASTSIVFTENKGDVFFYRGILGRQVGNSLHQIEADIDYETLKNYENSFQKTTSDGGVTTITYYGKNIVLKRRNLLASIGYTGNLAVKQNNPTWLIHAKVSVSDKKQTSIFYPVYRKQNIHILVGEMKLKRNFVKNAQIYSPYFSAIFSTGGGDMNKDGIYNSETTNETKAVSLDRLLIREYEYLTSTQGAGIGGFRYTRLLKLQKIAVYGDLSCNYKKAFSVDAIGSSFGSLTLKVGCTF
jgi:hypothetical protein